MNIDCWFCNSKQVDENSKNNIVYDFKKQSYADKLKNNKSKDNYKKQKVIIGRCDECFAAHEKCKQISLLCILPYAVIAIGMYMMFEKYNPISIAVVLMLGTLGFGAVSLIKTRYLKRKKTKALVQVGVKNEEIQHYLSDGWYR